jgi:hypothetical protein
MKKNRKRLMAAFMAVLMVLTLVPTWLLGGIFATTAKADGKEVTLSQMYKDGYILLNKDGKKVYSYEMKDANGTIADIEAVAPQGNLTDKKNYLNVKPSEAVTLDTDKDTVDKDSMPKDGYMKLTVKKDATDLKLYVNTSGTKQTICVVKKEGSDYTWVSKEYKADKAEKTGDKKSKYYTVDFGTVKSGEEYYIFVKASSAKDVAYWGYDITGNFVPVPAPDATKSVTTVTQDTTDTSKIVVNVKDLAVNEKGPAVYYSLQRVKVTYGTDGSPDWTKAEEIYKYTGKETSFSYEDTVSKTGVYYYRVVGKGLGSTDSNGTATTAGVSYEADVKVSVTGDVNKLTATWADIETATSYNVYVYKNTEACPSTPTKTISTEEIAAFKEAKTDISYTAEGLTAGVKYNVKVDAVREAGVKSGEVVTVRVLEDIDTSKAITGMKLVNQESTLPVTVIRDKSEITAFQPATTGGVSSKGFANTSYVILNDQIAADKDFTLTADVTVKANPASSGSGVYVGAFTDIEKAAAKLYAVGFRGANSGVYDMVYYRNKADDSYSGGKYNSTVNAYTLDTTYSVTVTRENGSYTTAVKSADGKVDLKSVSEEPSADLKGAVNVGFAIIGTTAVVNNLKVVSGSDTLIDASTFEGSFSPFSNNWDSYEGTSVTEAVNDNENGKVKVTVAGEIGTYGAGSIDVNMYNEAGELKDTKTVTAWNTTSNTVEFEPEASGTYYFEAVAKRTGVAKTYASSKYKSEGYMLPLKAAVLQLRTAEQSKIEVTWDAVPEATAYKVEYKKEGAAEFTFLEETTNLSAKTPSLTVGDVYIFRVTAVRSVDGQTKMSNEAQLKVAEHEQFTWKFSAFGQGVSVSNDNLSDKDKSKNGYSGGVNTDEGIVNVWSLDSKGKLVPASTDGVAFYYATIPTNKNFTLTATAKVNNWKYTNGQEGFGLMAADAVGNNGDSSVFWNNSYMASVTKVEYYSNVDEETGEATVSKTSGEKISMKLGIGSQEKIGVNKNNLSKLLDNDSDTVNNEFKTTMSTLETSKLGSAAGTFNLIGNYSNTDATFEGTTVENPITEVKLTIQKNNTGYFVSYTDAEGNTTTKKYYDTEALSQIDSDNVYVGMFASRTFDVTYSDISLTTIDPADDAPAEERPVEYKDIQVSVTSSSTASSEDYTFKGMSNADGHVVVTKGDDVIGETDVTANESFTIDTKLVAGDNKFVATFTPDENFKFGEYELPTSYDPIEVSKTVTYAYFTGDLIYVSADATKAVDEAKANETYSAKAQINSGKGTKDNPIDIYNAVAYARPGQKILLLDGDYKVANNLLIPFGIDGTDEKPIYLMSESSDSRVVLDFEGTTGEGITLCGNYWYIQNVDVTNSANGKDGIHVCGSHNVLDTVNTYKNGNTGIQISRYSSAQDKADWPAYNTIKNCISHNNADAGYEDADGFAAKLTIGKGNVFVGCIAHHNADDGWDFFAKVETGNIPSVVIMNCVAYGNGYIESENGLIDAGNGNGFKIGGSSLPGSHVIINSVAFDNKAKGIDSNSCPDNVVVGCTSFNNENSNVALYTNDAKNTNYRTNGIISYRNAYVKVADNLKARGTQDTAKLYDATDYYWLSASGDAKEASTLLTDANFVTLNTNDVKVTRNANGTINMNGLGMLTADTRKALGVGIGADSLDKAPQLTSEGYALVIDALGYDEANRVLGLSLESAFILRDGAEGALTGDSNNIAVMVVLLLASMAVAGGAIVYSKKRKVVSK